MFEKIGFHKFVIFRAPAIISTVKLSEDNYETMVMFEGGEEIESFHTSTIEEAKKKHDEIASKWNDKVYDGSIDKCLGVPNYGQFVVPVIDC